jgi:hypothetical protein
MFGRVTVAVWIDVSAAILGKALIDSGVRAQIGEGGAIADD